MRAHYEYMRTGRFTLARRSSAALIPLALCAALLAASPAQSDTEGNPPQAGITVPDGLTSAEQQLFRAIFGGAGEWAPEGTPVADSGFRPYPNGFSFMNFGPSLYLNQRFLGQPKPLAADGTSVRPARITSRDMRLVFGDGVCVAEQDLPPAGPCELTESAQSIVELASQWSRSGRCYGFATVAAGLFTGLVSPAALRTGEVNSMTPLNRPTQRALIRAVIAQYFSATGVRQASMQALIDTLRASLGSGQAIYTLLLFGEPGGHGVLPYAVLDRGSGRFDIAIYDPNFPNQARAVRVDANANSWEYEGSALPGSRSLRWSSASGASAAIWLGQVDSALTRQECPFCLRSSDDTLVAFSPLLSENLRAFDSVLLLRPNGTPLDPDLFEILPIVNPTVGDFASPPTIRVTSGVDFIVVLDGKDVRRSQPLTMTVIRPGEVRRIDLNDLVPQARTQVRIRALTPVSQVIADPLEEVRLMQTLEMNPSSYRFSADVLPRRGSVDVTLRVDRDRERITLANGSPNEQMVTLRMRSRTSDGTAIFVAREIPLPPRARIVGTYAGWEGAEGRPLLWMDLRAGDNRRDGVIDITRTPRASQ